MPLRVTPCGDFGEGGGGGSGSGCQSTNTSLKASKNWFTAFRPPCMHATENRWTLAARMFSQCIRQRQLPQEHPAFVIGLSFAVVVHAGAPGHSRWPPGSPANAAQSAPPPGCGHCSSNCPLLTPRLHEPGSCRVSFKSMQASRCSPMCQQHASEINTGMCMLHLLQRRTQRRHAAAGAAGAAPAALRERQPHLQLSGGPAGRRTRCAQSSWPCVRRDAAALPQSKPSLICCRPAGRHAASVVLSMPATRADRP